MVKPVLNTSAEVDAYYMGVITGIREYAAWKDGKQYVGIMQRPLETVIDEVMAERNEERARIDRNQDHQ